LAKSAHGRGAANDCMAARMGREGSASEARDFGPDGYL